MTQFHDILDLYGFTQDQSQGLLEAIELADCHLELNESTSLEEGLIHLNEVLQGCFLRPDDSERDYFIDKFDNTELKEKLLPLLSPFIEHVSKGDKIQTKLLMGGTENGIKERFKILIDLEQNGHHADTIYLLTGSRNLWIDHEEVATKMVIERLMSKYNISEINAKEELEQSIIDFFPDKTHLTAKRRAIVDHFTNIKEIIWPTETDMIQYLTDEYADHFLGTEFILVDTPKRIDPNGAIKRPNTRDTLIQMWKDYQEEIETQALNYPDKKLPVAVVTTQPFGIYQEIQTMSVFYNKPINISLIAKKYDSNFHISCIFDALARTIYAGKDFVLEKIRSRNT
jgi:hypothetical protein